MLISLLLALRLSVRIVYSEKLYLELKFGPFKLNGFFTGAAKGKKDKKTKPKKKISDAVEKEKKPLNETIEEILELVKVFASVFFKRLKIKTTRICIVVGSDDPAKTAVYYGTVIQSVAVLIDFLQTNTDFETCRNTVIRVDPDFVSGNTYADIDICLSATVLHILSTAITCTAFYLKKKKA